VFIKWTVKSNDDTIYLYKQVAMFTKAHNLVEDDSQSSVPYYYTHSTHKVSVNATKSRRKLPLMKHKQIPHSSFTKAPSSRKQCLFFNSIS
jgi:hypothetical protein